MFVVVFVGFVLVVFVFPFVFVIVFVFLLGKVWLEREVGYRQSMLAIWGQMEHKTITVMVNTTLACHHIRSASHNAILGVFIIISNGHPSS